jgi:hypothetical protein
MNSNIRSTSILGIVQEQYMPPTVTALINKYNESKNVVGVESLT